MEQIVEHQPELAGIRTRAVELEGEGPPLILLHGFADSADTWRLLIDRFRKRGRAAVALDLPGFGEAGRLEREAAILPQLDAFVDAAIERWAVESGSVVVAGNSLGGTVALRAAERDRMVLTSGAERLAEAIPGARVELIPRCGHCPQIEEPDQLAELVARFPEVPAEARPLRPIPG